MCEFCEVLQAVVDKSTRIAMMGDINARIGKKHLTV